MRKTALVVAAATVALLVAGGGAFAASRYIITSKGQIKPSVVRQLRGNRGPRGFRGARGFTGANGARGANGATGSSGIARIITVNSPDISLAPGALNPNGSLIAQCPAGSTVVGSGVFNSIASVGFVEKFGSFVGAAMVNNTGVTATGLHSQAICASGPGVVDSATAASGASGRAAYQRAYAAAKKASRR